MSELLLEDDPREPKPAMNQLTFLDDKMLFVGVKAKWSKLEKLSLKEYKYLLALWYNRPEEFKRIINELT